MSVFVDAYAERHCRVIKLKACLLMLMLKDTLEIMLLEGVFVYAYAIRHCRPHVV